MSYRPTYEDHHCVCSFFISPCILTSPLCTRCTYIMSLNLLISLTCTSYILAPMTTMVLLNFYVLHVGAWPTQILVRSSPHALCICHPVSSLQVPNLISLVCVFPAPVWRFYLFTLVNWWSFGGGRERRASLHCFHESRGLLCQSHSLSLLLSTWWAAVTYLVSLHHFPSPTFCWGADYTHFRVLLLPLHPCYVV